MPFKFEKLEVWHEAMDIGEEVDKLTVSFPQKELYNLSSQMRRAADSVALNIAEGSSAASDAEQVRFLNIAIRSCNEVVCCLHKAKRRGYLADDSFHQLYATLDKLCARLQAFRNKLRSAM
ncbi:four helix bundle protein [Phnomibacter sp. MR]|uniref:four helix bundle protein n=1 Tax=Phnomibacter sp. MR TaxID=3042318 RepID=UPI003A80A774